MSKDVRGATAVDGLDRMIRSDAERQALLAAFKRRDGSRLSLSKAPGLSLKTYPSNCMLREGINARIRECQAREVRIVGPILQTQWLVSKRCHG